MEEELIFTPVNITPHFFFFLISQMTLIQSFMPLNFELLTQAKLKLSSLQDPYLLNRK